MKPSTIVRSIVGAVAFTASCLRAAEPLPQPHGVSSAPGAEVSATALAKETKREQSNIEGSRKPIVHDGQTFELANSTATKAVETDEYTTSGEKLGEWTQLVTVQRLTLEKPTSADAFVKYFKKRVAEDGATLELLGDAKPASVFAVRFPKSDRNDEQVMICFAFADPARPELLNIVQYAIKPTKCPVDLAAARIKSWRDKFLAQAKALAAPNS